MESESNDRSDIILPGKQLQLLQDVVKFGTDRICRLFCFASGLYYLICLFVDEHSLLQYRRIHMHLLI